MSNVERNRHHCVSRSFRGVGGDVNCTVPLCEIHRKMHGVVGYIPPDFVTRLYLLSLVDWRTPSGRGIPVSMFRHAYDQLLSHDWRNLYDKDAIQRNSERDDPTARAVAAIHVHNAVSQELYGVADAMSFLRSGNYLGPERHAFVASMMELFATNDPIHALRKYLSERDINGDRMWTKPIPISRFSKLLDGFQFGQLDVHRKNEKESIIQIMEEWRYKLRQAMHSWHPQLHTHLPTINAERRGKPFFASFIDQRSRTLV